MRSETKDSEAILGFYGDSSIVVEQRRVVVDWYQTWVDEYSKARSTSSRIRIYNFISDRYETVIPVPEFSGVGVRGLSLYFKNGSSLWECRIPEKKTYPSRLPPHGNYSVSAENAVFFACENGINTVTSLRTGRVLHRDTTQDGHGRVCRMDKIVSTPSGWIVYGSSGYPMQFRFIDESGIQGRDTLAVTMAGFFFVHGLGEVAYYRGTDGWAVPSLFDPDGGLTLAFRKILARDQNAFWGLNMEQGLYISHEYLRGDFLRSLESGEAVYTPHGFD